MDRDSGPDRLSFFGTALPPWFQLRVVTVPSGHQRAYDQTEWRDALVIVERGEIDLECLGGSRERFGRGEVLWLTGLPLRALHNPGREPALLVAVSRRRPEPSAEVPRPWPPSPWVFLLALP
ncbi:MAG TPA: hypothetical protein VG276_21570 [Actinomycetes bacterium]|jgi:hypothetical protein|nr:hypothetical protein [Actinomycetes bacterium]